MAPGSQLAQERPGTLPADFGEWDGGGPPETLPADFDGFDAVPGVLLGSSAPAGPFRKTERTAIATSEANSGDAAVKRDGPEKREEGVNKDEPETDSVALPGRSEEMPKLFSAIGSRRRWWWR